MNKKHHMQPFEETICGLEIDNDNHLLYNYFTIHCFYVYHIKSELIMVRLLYVVQKKTKIKLIIRRHRLFFYIWSYIVKIIAHKTLSY